MTVSLCAIWGAAFALALILVPVCGRLARAAGLVDWPDNHRKIHGRPVPLAGGAALLLAVPAALALLAAASPDARAALAANGRWLAALAAGALLIGALGLLDDAFVLRWRHKLIGQVVAVAVVVLGGGVEVRQVVLFGTAVDLGTLAAPFAALWLLGAVNSLNLLDGMDGLLGTLGGLIGLALAALAALSGQWGAALVALALSGALAGFLCYNRPRASVFLGDSGSMTVGLAVGALALQTAPRAGAAVDLVPAAALLVLPILDTAAAVVRRKLTGRSIACGDRAHLHHCLLGAGLSPWRVLVLVAGLTALAGMGAVAAAAVRDDLYAAAAALMVAGLLAAGRLFGHAELVLLLRHLQALLPAARPHPTMPWSRRLEVRLQGSAGWEGLWEELAERAEELNLQSLCLDVNLPSAHEGYHARWDRLGGPPAGALVWRAELPLCLGPQTVARLTVVGVRDHEPVGEKLAVLTEQAETAFPALLPKSAPKPHLEPVRVG
jgi:UDP-GlcNAc:undecaprenyl-phosphate GlcNAc-1-phosphate transferase